MTLESKTHSNDSNPEFEDYYTLLGVPPTARLMEIKKAFRMLQRKVHPDASHSPDTRHVSAKLNEAYQILSNSLSRLEYDLAHNFKAQNALNLSKLEQFRRRKAEKLRENLSASANRSRDIESKVVSSYSDGKQIKNCGLIITKARYGLIGLEKKHLRNAKLSMQRSKSHTFEPPQNIQKLKSKKSVINTGYDSETESVINPNVSNLEYTIEVTDALQCMVTHRGQNGGYIEIEDGYDKSNCDGFYMTVNSNGCESEQKYLEIEYSFNRKYHYVRCSNFEYVCIPNQAHIVTLFDGTQMNESEPKKRSINLNWNAFATFVPNACVTLQIRPQIIELPSGKRALTSRPSLIGLKKFSEIEKLRGESGSASARESGGNGKGAKKGYGVRVIKWSVCSLMIVGAIGGLGYYYVDKQQRLERNRNETTKEVGVFGEIDLWQESIVLYIQKYWNWIVGNELSVNRSEETE